MYAAAEIAAAAAAAEDVVAEKGVVASVLAGEAVRDPCLCPSGLYLARMANQSQMLPLQLLRSREQKAVPR